MANLHTPTRRGLLGAMAVVPAAGAFGTVAFIPASASSGAWDAAVVRYNVAWAALENHPFNSVIPSHPDYDRLDAAFTPYANEATVSVDDLMALPAPNGDGVIEKLAIYIREYGDNSGSGHLASILADLRRLAAEGR